MNLSIRTRARCTPYIGGTPNLESDVIELGVVLAGKDSEAQHFNAVCVALSALLQDAFGVQVHA